MIDTLVNNLQKALKTRSYQKYGLKKGSYAYVTLHRQSNVDNKRILAGILGALTEISKTTALVFPIHPRTMQKLERFGLLESLRSNKNIFLTQPIGYLENISFQANAKVVLTDSGGIQEESSFLNVPCITLRRNTERPITVTEGTNQVVGINKERIIDAYRRTGIERSRLSIKYWDGKTATRIVEQLKKIC